MQQRNSSLLAISILLFQLSAKSDRLLALVIGHANPDVEILNAVEPGLATTGGPPLILASSPARRREQRPASSCRAMIAFRAKSLGLSVAQARLAGTPSRIPSAAMTWRMPLAARQRSPNSADTTPACAGCRATTTTATPGSASVFKPSLTAGGASDYDRVLRAHAESGRHIADFSGNAVCPSRVTARLTLPISSARRRLRSISGRSRRSPSCSIRSEANSTAALAPQRHEILAYAVNRMIRS